MQQLTSTINYYHLQCDQVIPEVSVCLYIFAVLIMYDHIWWIFWLTGQRWWTIVIYFYFSIMHDWYICHLMSSFLLMAKFLYMHLRYKSSVYKIKFLINVHNLFVLIVDNARLFAKLWLGFFYLYFSPICMA